MPPSSSASNRAPLAIARIAAPIREQVVHQLRHAITSGLFRPGDRLIERELCAQLGVSRTSLREALRQLESDGLVTALPYKGIVVSSLTPEEARQVYQVRAVIEGLAGRLFAEQATPSQCTQLTTAMQAIEAALAEGNLAHLVEAKAHFYHLLLSGCGNQQAMQVLQSLHDRIAFLRTLTLAQPGRAAQSVAEMRQILVAILARDGRQAEQACIQHVERAAAVAATVLHQREAEPLAPHDQGPS